MAIGLVGLVLIIEPWQLRGVLSSLLALGGALCFAAGAVVAKVLRRRHEVELVSLTAWQGLLGAIPLVVVAILFPGEGIHWSSTFVWSLVYSVLIGTALGTIVWLYVLNALPANMAGIGTIGAPVVGVLASWILLGEDFSAAEIVGMVLVVLALGLLVVRGHRTTGQSGTDDANMWFSRKNRRVPERVAPVVHKTCDRAPWL